MKISVDLSGNVGNYPECPLRSDLNSCGAFGCDKRNKINCCPQLDDEGEKYFAPEWCPIRNGGVEIVQK